MEGYRQLDAAGSTALRSALITVVALALYADLALAQSVPDRTTSQLHQLFQEQKWEEIARLRPELGISADTDFEYGIALAHLKHWQEAREAFESGLRLSPHDARFMIELAGIAFKQGNYQESETWLRKALQLSPKDSYALDFLGTVFYLQGNIDAALKYWNGMGKPQISSVIAEPRPKLNPVLLDRAFAFSAASTLRLQDLRTSEARVRQLDVFPTFRFDLVAQPDTTFGTVFHARERNGCAGNSWKCLLVVFGQTPAQTASFSYYNIENRAVNFTSSFRWDGEKRRFLGELEFPVAQNPTWQLQLGGDVRNENWAIRNSFSGPAPLLAALNLKREVGSLRFNDVMNGNWQWFATTEVSNRDYRNLFAGSHLSPELLTSGFQLKQSFGFQGSLLRFPERRLDIDGSASASLARLWSGASRDYLQFRGSVSVHWFPQATGQKYEIQHDLRVGKMLGTPPFDELSMLGVLGDTNLYMRAHIATRGGKKGSAPMGRDYFLSNFRALRDVSPVAIAHIKVGPFVDTGKINDPLPQFGSHKWLWDAGVEARLEGFGFTLTVSYGRDLRSGRNAFVATSP